MKLIAINGLTLTITNALSGNAVIQTSPSTVSKINGSGIYRGPLTINVTGFEDATISSGIGTGVLQPTSQSLKVDGMNVNFINDSVDINVSGPLKSDPSKTGTSVAHVVITDAGQSEVKAE